MTPNEATVVTVLPIDEVLSLLDGVKKTSKGHSAKCPAHDDSKPSLSVWVQSGQVRFKCRGGCEESEVANALGIELGQRVTGGKATKKKDTAAPAPLADSQVEEWHAALLNDKKTLAYVTGTLKLSLDVVKQLKLGLWDEGAPFSPGVHRRLTYPYRLGAGWSHANARALDGQEPKCRLDRYGRKSRLYLAETLRPGGVAMLFEGERDAAAALTLGLHEHLPDSPSIVAIQGVDQAKMAAEELLSQRFVYLATDNDEPGDKAAVAIASILGKDKCRRVKFGDAKDLGDVLAAEGLDALDEVLISFDEEAELEVKSTFKLTDAGNAERFVTQHHDHVRHVHDWRSWVVWDGTRWKKDDDEVAVTTLAIQTARSMYSAAVEGDLVDRARLLGHSLKSESQQRLQAMIGLAAKNAQMAMASTSFDRDMDMLNVLNGMLDLSTGELLPHDKEKLITKLVPVAYNPAATAPTFMRFLEQVIPDQAVREYLQRAVGYTLTGSVEEQCLFFCHGDGSNGKTTFFETIRNLLGCDYARVGSPDLLLSTRNDKSPQEIARLQGARMVTTTEVEQGRQWNESLLKSVTGEEKLVGRYLYAPFFEFDPAFKIWVAGNHKPGVRGADDGIWRRIHLIPFTVKIAADKKDTKLPKKLVPELPGILTWAVQGAIAWRRHGLKPPKAVLEATAEYRSKEDIVASFIEDSCNRSGRASYKDLFAGFTRWVEQNNERGKNIMKRTFIDRVVALGFERTKSNGEQFIAGLSLKAKY